MGAFQGRGYDERRRISIARTYLPTNYGVCRNFLEKVAWSALSMLYDGSMCRVVSMNMHHQCTHRPEVWRSTQSQLLR